MEAYKLSIIKSIAAFIAALLIVTTVFCNKKSSSEYHIGVVLSLTGRGNTFGKRALNGMNLAAEEINSKEYFKKQPIKLLVEDTESSASRALSAFTKLTDIDKVVVTVGFVLSDEVLTCAPMANERKVVLLTTAAGSDKIKDAGDYIFRNRESGAVQSHAIAKLAIEKFGFKEIAILHSNAANGISYKDGFMEAADSLGAKIISVVGYNEGKTDYRAEIQEIMVKKNKAVYLAGLDTELGLILKQSRELGFSPQFFASAGAVSQKILEIAGNAAEGLVCARASFDIESTNSQIHSFVSSYEGHFGEKPDFIAANSYDAIMMIAMLFEKGLVKSDEIRNGLYGIKNFPGVGGVTTFDANGEVIKPISFVQIQKGSYIELR